MNDGTACTPTHPDRGIFAERPGAPAAGRVTVREERRQ